MEGFGKMSAKKSGYWETHTLFIGNLILLPKYKYKTKLPKCENPLRTQQHTDVDRDSARALLLLLVQHPGEMERGLAQGSAASPSMVHPPPQ